MQCRGGSGSGPEVGFWLLFFFLSEVEPVFSLCQGFLNREQMIRPYPADVSWQRHCQLLKDLPERAFQRTHYH